MPRDTGVDRTAKAAAPATAPHLTPRQREVLLGLSEGLTYPQIATQLGLSAATVRTYVGEIYAALNVHKAGAAIHVAMLAGLL